MNIEINDQRFADLLSRWRTLPSRDEMKLDEIVDRLTVDRGQLPRFVLLLFLSVVVATFGLVANSTAVVIGAMLLAPLMTPVLGFAIGLTSLQRARMGKAAALVLGHPGVKDVALIAKPDERLGGRACACVVLDEGATLSLADLVAYLRETHQLATQKLPEYLEVVAELPRTATGKV